MLLIYCSEQRKYFQEYNIMIVSIGQVNHLSMISCSKLGFDTVLLVVMGTTQQKTQSNSNFK